jgi:hypothetical protein
MLEGLRSPWTMPWECRYDSAPAAAKAGEQTQRKRYGRG